MKENVVEFTTSEIRILVRNYWHLLEMINMINTFFVTSLGSM